jgi:hypothetical protein
LELAARAERRNQSTARLVIMALTELRQFLGRFCLLDLAGLVRGAVLPQDQAAAAAAQQILAEQPVELREEPPGSGP